MECTLSRIPEYHIQLCFGILFLVYIIAVAPGINMRCDSVLLPDFSGNGTPDGRVRSTACMYPDTTRRRLVTRVLTQQDC